MKTMDNAKVIKTMEKCALHVYLKTLIDSQLDKVTLFSCFPQTGRANISAAKELVLVKNLSRLLSLNSGQAQN